jgi:hypothetical protein
MRVKFFTNFEKRKGTFGRGWGEMSGFAGFLKCWA